MGAARPAPCSHAARLGAPRPWPGRSAKSSSSSAAAGSSHGSGAPSVSRLCLSAAPAVDLERGPRGCPGPEPPGSLVGSRTGRRGGDAEGRGLQPGAAPPNASPAVGAGMRGPQDPSRSGPSPPRPRMRPVALVQVQRGLSAERDLQTPQAGAEELRETRRFSMLSRLVWNSWSQVTLHLDLQKSWDYRHEAPCPANTSVMTSHDFPPFSLFPRLSTPIRFYLSFFFIPST
uniref:uncharacterized protein LOC118152039 isoform X2 n=1 Tax=Callithrix jacchus TaxID=9483 RepID=UPI0023DD6134|nr:uncharacterized protein LOC118152039 isoform X2 [Callithrix jacchus]